jgi:hydroxylamine reductase (hybrid-cluster protein)
MNVDAVVIAPNASWPGLETLAATYGIPVVLTGEGKEIGEIAAEAIAQASHHAQRTFSGAASRTIRACTAGRGAVLRQVRELGQAFDEGRIRGVAVLFGEANAKQTFFDRTLALMEAALAERAIVLLGGELGSEADALTAELDKRQAGGLSAFAAGLAKDGLHPVSAFGPVFELPRVVSLLNATPRESGGAALPVVFAFPEFSRSSTWAGAVSLLSLGFTVQIGIRLPFWGSPWLMETLMTEWPQIAGGRLLAAPALPDARAQAEELAACLRAGRA